MKRAGLIRTILFILALAVFLFSGYQIVRTLFEEKQSEDLYENLTDSVVSMMTEPQEDATKPDEKASAPITVDFAELLRQNSDVVGWIYCENTPINYPVMKSDDYNDYLRRLMNGKYNTAGSIFMDYRSAADLSSLNTILYGHNMRNNTMFGTLKEYREQTYYEEHPVLWFLTPNGDYKMEVIAGYETATDSQAYEDFTTQEALQEYIAQAMEKSTFQANVDTEDITQVMTLSTCVRGKETKRYVLIGSLIPV